MKDISKKYSNGEVTIIWKPGTCIHSARCWKGESGLMQVFNPAEKPWIKPEGASTQRIIEQIKKCPSGALTYEMNSGVEVKTDTTEKFIVEAAPNGPLLVHGNITVKDKSGAETERTKVTAFCRCGASSNKPYCDGSHHKVGFKD